MAAKTWNGAASGGWAVNANWTPSGYPVAADDVTIAGSSTYQVVTGPGNSASLTLLGNTTLNGAFNTGALQVGSAATPGGLSLAAGTTLNATSATVLYGPLQASGSNTRLAITGALTLGGTRTGTAFATNSLAVTAGAAVQAASLALIPAAYGDTVAVDALSTLEIGSGGVIGAGQIVVDAGRSIAGMGSLAAANGIVDQGVILAQGGTLSITSPVTGSGQMQIAAGATLALTGATGPSTAPVSFTGAGGTLLLGTYSAYSNGALVSNLAEQGVISGFATGDLILYSGTATLSAATYLAGSNGLGTLTLSSGTATIGTLTLAGSYAGYGFQVTPTTGSGANIALVATGGTTAGTGGGGTSGGGTSASDAYAWLPRSGGAWSATANWLDITAGAIPAIAVPGSANAVTITGPQTYQVVSGPGSAASLAMLGNTTLNGAFSTGALQVGSATASAQAVIDGSASQLAVGGDTIVAASAGPSALLAASNGGRIQAAGLTLNAAGTIRADGASLLQVGAGAASGTGIRIAAGATLTAHGGRIEGDVSDLGTLANDGGLVITGALTGSGALTIGTGLTDIGTVSGVGVTFAAAGSTLRVHALQGATRIGGFQPGDAVDLAGITGATLSTDGRTVAAGAGTIALAAAPSGYACKLYGDANGGTAILLNPTAPPAGAVHFTNAATGASGTATGDDYTGPVDYLQRQYIYAGSDSVAIAAQVPNTFLKGGPGSDALLVQGGNNVLDGGTGSNFLIGGSGADGGRDTFFVDSRGGGVTWGTIVNFHPGDQATIFGFDPAASTRPFTAADGTAGFTGVTIHSEIGGTGTGVTASMTFAGIDQATAEQHFVFSTGTLPGSIGYLLIQYQ